MPNVNKLKLVADAIAAQVTGRYSADSWMYTNVEAMTKVWQGVKGTSAFFFGEEDAREATGAYERTRMYQYAETLWHTAQVRPHETKGYGTESGNSWSISARLPRSASVAQTARLAAAHCCSTTSRAGNRRSGQRDASTFSRPSDFRPSEVASSVRSGRARRIGLLEEKVARSGATLTPASSRPAAASASAAAPRR